MLLRWLAKFPCKSVFLCFLALGICETAEALPSPPHLGDPTKFVRVLIANTDSFSVSGTDLLLNKSQRLDGESILSFKCGLDSQGNSFVEFGLGRILGGKITLDSLGGFMQLNSRSYRSELVVVPKGDHCEVINILPIDKYLAGLLNVEMSPSWPLEALKAQAVSSRSYAYFKMEENKNADFDLESSTQDQVYQGAGSETPKSNLAVELTKNVRLTTPFFAPFKAYFHSNCGGRTEVPESVWGNADKLYRPVVCPYHNEESKTNHWNASILLSTIENSLRRFGGLLPSNFQHLARLEPGQRNKSLRMKNLLAWDAKGNSLRISAAQFRNAIGNTKIKSTAFSLTGDQQQVNISGSGFGHGVGLCQVGARAMAKLGYNYQQILRHYYPLAKITNVD